MPDKSGRFTQQEKTFIGHYVETGNGRYAATKAGYAQPDVRASEKLANPIVLAEVQRQQHARLVNEVLPLAVGRHVAMLKDPNVVGASLNKAVELAYKYGLANKDGDQVKEPHEMSAGELAAAISTLERVAADRATPVEAVEVRPESGLFD